MSEIRVAKKPEDIQIGQTVICRHRGDESWDEAPFLIRNQRHLDDAFKPWDAWTVVILTDPPPPGYLVPAKQIEALRGVLETARSPRPRETAVKVSKSWYNAATNVMRSVIDSAELIDE
jgi:hypothetical protein